MEYDFKDQFAQDVFSYMCFIDAYSLYDYVVSMSLLMKHFSCTLYKVQKAVHSLRDIGLVENKCIGRPAVFSCGEITELEYDAQPPLHGFIITDNARKTDTYKQKVEDYNCSLADWVNV